MSDNWKFLFGRCAGRTFKEVAENHPKDVKWILSLKDGNGNKVLDTYKRFQEYYLTPRQHCNVEGCDIEIKPKNNIWPEKCWKHSEEKDKKCPACGVPVKFGYCYLCYKGYNGICVSRLF